MVEQPARHGKMTERPLAAAGLVLLGGLILFIEGVGIIVVATPVGQSAYSTFPSDAASIGGLGAFLGFVLFLLGIYLLLEPPYHRGFGIAALVLSLITLWINFAFLIPVVLMLAGGILAFVFKPEVEAGSMTRVEDRSRPLG